MRTGKIAIPTDQGRRRGRPVAGRLACGGKGRFLPLIVALALFSASLFVRPVSAADQGQALLALQEKMEASYARINDYVTIFHKQERVDGKLLPEETILLKFQKPLKIYMDWIKEPLKGTEALYVEGENDNKLLAHKGGFFGFVTVSLDPRGSTAMKGNRHPITEAGFGFLLKEMRRNLDKALQYGEIEVTRLGDDIFQGRPATVVEGRFTPHEGRKYYASRMVIHIDKELVLPVGAVFYDQNDVLFEKYAFTDVKLNVGLTEMDFSRYNDKYRF